MIAAIGISLAVALIMTAAVIAAWPWRNPETVHQPAETFPDPVIWVPRGPEPDLIAEYKECPQPTPDAEAQADPPDQLVNSG